MVVAEKVLSAWRKETAQRKKEFILKKDLKVSKVTPPRKPINNMKK